MANFQPRKDANYTNRDSQSQETQHNRVIPRQNFGNHT